MDHAGAKEEGRPILERIAAELASGPRDEKLELVAGSVNGYLNELSAAK